MRNFVTAVDMVKTGELQARVASARRLASLFLGFLSRPSPRKLPTHRAPNAAIIQAYESHFGILSFGLSHQVR
jgi:hypothetical protein